MSGTGGDGVLVEAYSVNTTGLALERNVARHNADDGMDIDIPGVAVAKNRALRNRDLGIEAVPGTIDGGGNKAKDNGDPAQCTNVACK